MPLPVTQPSKLPAEAMPWARQVSDAVNGNYTKVEKFLSDQTNRNRATATNAQRLSDQVGKLAQAQADLANTQAGLADTTAQLQTTVSYLNGLVTVSDNGTTYSSGDIPGDATFRYTGGAASVTLRVPTGRMLVTVGSGQCTLQPGAATAIADVTFQTSAPSGWGEAPNTQRDSRLFLSSGTYLGTPLVVNKVIEGVPTDENITVRQFFGSWASGSGANAQWSGNYLVVQVLDN